MKIEKCDACSRYDHKNDRMKNKLKCMFQCEEYKLDQARRAFEYNRVVSGDNFDTEIMYEHGKQVFGSGCKNESS
jgi:hypothetical protein